MKLFVLGSSRTGKTPFARKVAQALELRQLMASEWVQLTSKKVATTRKTMTKTKKMTEKTKSKTKRKSQKKMATMKGEEERC